MLAIHTSSLFPLRALRASAVKYRIVEEPETPPADSARPALLCFLLRPLRVLGGRGCRCGLAGLPGADGKGLPSHVRLATACAGPEHSSLTAPETPLGKSCRAPCVHRLRRASGWRCDVRPVLRRLCRPTMWPCSSADRMGKNRSLPTESYR